MVRGLYTAYTGLLNQQHCLDTITNNLANSATSGFKKEGTTAQAFNDILMQRLKDETDNWYSQPVGNATLGVKIGENYTDYGQGNLKETGNTFDMAIGGDGFFAISFLTKKGEEIIRYTRAGSFTLNKDGYLVTKDGDFVQGRHGNIQMTIGAETTIDDKGNIYQGKNFIDTIKIVDFQDYNYLKKYGENLYTIVDGAQQKEVNAPIHQGFVETSNVNVISEMVDMITISRTFEANQKFVQTVDESLSKDANLGAL